MAAAMPQQEQLAEMMIAVIEKVAGHAAAPIAKLQEAHTLLARCPGATPGTRITVADLEALYAWLRDARRPVCITQLLFVGAGAAIWERLMVAVLNRIARERAEPGFTAKYCDSGDRYTPGWRPATVAGTKAAPFIADHGTAATAVIAIRPSPDASDDARPTHAPAATRQAGCAVFVQYGEHAPDRLPPAVATRLRRELGWLPEAATAWYCTRSDGSTVDSQALRAHFRTTLVLPPTRIDTPEMKFAIWRGFVGYECSGPMPVVPVPPETPAQVDDFVQSYQRCH